MKIGIYTQPLHTNYGGILQAYALQTVLEKLGHKVVILKKPHERRVPIFKRPFSYGKRFIKKYLFHQKCRIFKEKYFNQTYYIVGQNTLEFINKHIHMLPLTELKASEIDLLIVGSDQVWRPIYNHPIEDSYLDFAKKWPIKRIAYAASFGTDQWEYTPRQTARCKRLLKQFSAISVRESTGVDLCQKYFNMQAKLVLDPTMLLDKDAYTGLIKANITSKTSGNLLIYILDESSEKQELIKEISKTQNYIPFRVNSLVENHYAPLEQRIQPPVEDWLQGFNNADFIITDSFHACAFSIIFNKPFIVYGNKERGYTRFQSLLSLFGLESRLITSKEEALNIVNNPINWSQVNSKREQMKNISLSFLKHNI